MTSNHSLHLLREHLSRSADLLSLPATSLLLLLSPATVRRGCVRLFWVPTMASSAQPH